MVISAACTQVIYRSGLFTENESSAARVVRAFVASRL